MKETKVEISTIGIALESISSDERGPCYFKGYGRVEVHALEGITQYREVVVVDANNGVVERVIKTTT